jgi:hypothetical protein
MFIVHKFAIEEKGVKNIFRSFFSQTGKGFYLIELSTSDIGV